MVKYCSECGAKLDDNAQFCGNCGKSQVEKQNKNELIIIGLIAIIAILSIKKTTESVSYENREDNTEQITQKVKAILFEKPKSFAQKRLFNAYPKLRLIRIRVKRQINKTKEDINQKIDDTKELIDGTIDRTKEEINRRIKKRK